MRFLWLLLFPCASFAADVTATGWTCSATAPASITIDAGSNRKIAYVITQEINTTRSVTLTSIGGQSPTETLSYAEASVTQDHWHDYYIFNEAAIAAMSGSSVVESGTASIEDRCWAVIDDTDQAELSALTGTAYIEGVIPTLDCTTTSSSGDYVVVTALASVLRDFSSWDTLTEFNDTDTSSQTHGGGAGNGGDNTTTVTISSAAEFTCAALVFPNVSSNAAVLRRRR